jgi:hypothetical protein
MINNDDKEDDDVSWIYLLIQSIRVMMVDDY